MIDKGITENDEFETFTERCNRFPTEMSTSERLLLCFNAYLKI